jgi:rare lipoprotein A
MNQHRWTCLTTVVLTTVLTPIANVYAQVPASGAIGLDHYQQQSLPIITPLTVTELETDVAVPKIASRYSSENLPDSIDSIAPIQPIPSNQSKPPTEIEGASSNPLPTEAAVLPLQNAKQIDAPLFLPDNPNHLVVKTPNSKNITLPTKSLKTVGKVAPLKNPPQPFTVQTVSPTLVVKRNGGLKSTKITNTATIQAEFSRLPQSAPSIGQTQDLPDTIGFAGGTPIFVFESDRPQQIFATAIAQVGNMTIASEPSISIPVQRPNQPIVPTVTPISTQFAPSPAQPDRSIQQPTPTPIVAIHTGKASWYGREAGPKTANGERYNPNGLTAAHRTLPFGTKVRVISLKTGKSVTVRINDRGPFRRNRIIDISAGAAAAIGIKKDGIGNVRMEVLANDG